MAELPHAIMTQISELMPETATLTMSDGQILRWPRRLLHADSAVGDRVHLLALGDREAEAERQRLAKQVLQEMLRGE